MAISPAVENQVATSPSKAGGSRLEQIAESLTKIAATVESSHPLEAAGLLAHVAELRGIDAAGRESSAPSEASEPEPALVNASGPSFNKLKRRCTVHLEDFRKHAAEAVSKKTESDADFVDDLEEVDVRTIKDGLAVSYWRMCSGLRIYRSESVTKALRLICSAPVPGLKGTSYLEVFKTLTTSGWSHHIYLFGGLVRDILRRKVGNDIDIAFSAPASELEEICQQHSYKCHVDGDYILIGEEDGEEYLEGMVITHNGIQPAYHSDFSMNWLFYDFCNDVIVDKTGEAVKAVRANLCEIPCPRDEWQLWVETNGPRVLFRYFKFLIRSHTYVDSSMAYVAEQLLAHWERDEETTIDAGRGALGDMVASKNVDKIELMRQLVLKSFNLAASGGGKKSAARAGYGKRRATLQTLGEDDHVCKEVPQSGRTFFSGSSWWQKGWLKMLKLTPSEGADAAAHGV